jgi:hypothetical protein
MLTVHSRDGKHFLGLRRDKAGAYQIVYGGGSSRRRLIWSITNQQVDEHVLSRCVLAAVNSRSALDALRDGLLSSKLAFEVDVDLTGGA